MKVKTIADLLALLLIFCGAVIAVCAYSNPERNYGGAVMLWGFIAWVVGCVVETYIESDD